MPVDKIELFICILSTINQYTHFITLVANMNCCKHDLRVQTQAIASLNQPSIPTPKKLTDQQVIEGLNDYYYVRDSRFYGTKFIEALYYTQTGVVVENIRVGVVILTRQGGDVYICLVKENANDKKLQKWGIPKGGIESQDTMKGKFDADDDDIINITAHREVDEELSYNIPPTELGKCTIFLVNVPQRRDSNAPRKPFGRQARLDDLSVFKPTLNVYFLYAMDGAKRGFDINDPYKGRNHVHGNDCDRLDQMWLKLTPDVANSQVYREMNLSSRLTIDALIGSLDTLTYH